MLKKVVEGNYYVVGMGVKYRGRWREKAPVEQERRYGRSGRKVRGKWEKVCPILFESTLEAEHTIAGNMPLASLTGTEGNKVKAAQVELRYFLGRQNAVVNTLWKLLSLQLSQETPYSRVSLTPVVGYEHTAHHHPCGS